MAARAPFAQAHCSPWYAQTALRHPSEALAIAARTHTISSCVTYQLPHTRHPTTHPIRHSVAIISPTSPRGRGLLMPTALIGRFGLPAVPLKLVGMPSASLSHLAIQRDLGATLLHGHPSNRDQNSVAVALYRIRLLQIGVAR